jgi:dCMP deaminase
MDEMYMDIAYRVAKMSYARRKKVGAVIVKDGNIVSFGWNGTPHGFDNNCEHETADGLVTVDELIHAEQNAFAKAAKGVIPVDGGTLYVTLSPCWYCSGTIIQSGIDRVVYDEEYRKPESIQFIDKAEIKIEKIYDGYNKPNI